MEETPVQQCSVCGASKPLTNEFYGTKADSKTGFRNRCKTCFNNARSAKKKTPEIKALARLERIVKEAEKTLADPSTPFSIRHKADQTIRNYEKRKAKLLKPIEEQHAAEEAAKFQQAANPSLARVRALGNEMFAADGNWLPVSERPAQLARLKAALETLTGPADEAARAYLQTSIQALEEMLGNTAARESFVAQQEQETIDGRACQDAADAIHAKFAGLFGEGVSAVEREKLKALFQIVREEAQQQHKAIKPDDMTATSANRKKVSSRILEELTAIAGRLGKAGTEVGPGQSLENVQSLELGKVVGGMQMRAYVRKLTAQLEEARATMTPKEYVAKFLNLPVAPKEETVVWKARVDNQETWYWSDGRVVRKAQMWLRAT